MSTSTRPPVFGIVAGELSGDTLGAGLIRALRARYPDARFIGICGPQMIAEGGHSLVPMERLSVMGLIEVLGRLKELFAVRDQLLSYFEAERIDVFIGIDAPDFNLRMEEQLRGAGIPTVHYVSPSVWAWRQGRIKWIARAVNTVLCLLPFEKAFYDQHKVPAVFVGHPLADALPMENDTAAARTALGIPLQGPYVALLPGSRGGEIRYVAPSLFAAAVAMQKEDPALQFLVPAVSQQRRREIETVLAASGLRAQVFDDSRGAGVGREVMAASDVVLLASGTATLEALLLKKPMVVAYRLHWLTYLLARLLVRIPFVSLPNLLAGKALVPELIQHAATPQNIAAAAFKWLRDAAYRQQQVAQFHDLHALLRQNADETAAIAVVDTMNAARARPLLAEVAGETPVIATAVNAISESKTDGQV
jgi:lipid-A-disaccharide synthase